MPQTKRQRGQAQAAFATVAVLHILIAAGVRVPGHDVSFLVDEFSKQRFHSVLIKSHFMAISDGVPGCHDFPQSQKLSQRLYFLRFLPITRVRLASGRINPHGKECSYADAS
jgi:hypothetical protein